MDCTFNQSASKKITALIRSVILFACLFFTSNYLLAEQLVTIVSSSNSNYHQSLLQSIKTNLEQTNIKIKRIDTEENQQSINVNNGIIISIGKKANNLLEKSDLSIPQIKVVTKIEDRERKIKNKSLLLSMTQPACLQLALIQELNPAWTRVSVLLSKPNAELMKNLTSCTTKKPIKIKPIFITEFVNIIDALNSSLSNTDVLLSFPDATVYNSKTIKSILLTTYRHRVPVIGFSENFVRAGALSAIHSSAQQLGKQIAELIIDYYNIKNIDGRTLYPKYFDVIINKNVAKSLGITTPNRKVITRQLQKHE